MRKCAALCMRKQKQCQEQECRLWIDYSEDLNCTLVAVRAHGAMTLAEVAKRLGYTPARILQIAKRALKKIALRAADLKEFLFDS